MPLTAILVLRPRYKLRVDEMRWPRIAFSQCRFALGFSISASIFNTYSCRNKATRPLSLARSGVTRMLSEYNPDRIRGPA
jgi:hypothetical protein